MICLIYINLQTTVTITAVNMVYVWTIHIMENYTGIVNAIVAGMGRIVHYMTVVSDILQFNELDFIDYIKIYYYCVTCNAHKP